MQIPLTLLEKFFSGKCTEAEKLRVQAYLRQHPESLEAYFTEHAWQKFEPPAPLNGSVSERMFFMIEKQTDKKVRLSTVLFRRAAVAAAVLVCIGVWQWANNGAELKKTLAQLPLESPVPAPVKFKFHLNTTNKNLSVALADGSTVELAPASEIRYAQTFSTVDRNIYLQGKALFKVATDKARPFTVFAGHLSTTALGTVFRVTEQGAVKVELLQGSVVIRPDSVLHARGIKDTYLKPGQQLTFDPLSFALSVRKAALPEASQTRKIIAKQIFQFNNQPLADIIKTLETTHHLRFIYADSLLNEMNFTGVFNENKETLNDFLSTVCLLNNLTMTKKEDGIHIVPNDR